MKIWLDDQLDDPKLKVRHTPEGWTGAKNASEFKKLIDDAMESGEPIEAINFDNDLGEETEGRHLVKWLQEKHPEIIELNPDIELEAHSANNVANEAIRHELNILRNKYKELIEAKTLPHPFEGKLK